MEKNANKTKEEINNEFENEQKACSIIDPDCEACQ
jgi:hypothetical protein